MHEIENHLTDAIEIVSSWDLDDDAFSEAVNAQARLLAGICSDDVWRFADDGSHSLH